MPRVNKNPELRSFWNQPATAPFQVLDAMNAHQSNHKEDEQMNTRSLILASFATMVLSLGAAQAGPCDTGGQAANKDAGSGPTVGSTAQTTGKSADANQHPPTSTMNRAAGDVATSSRDAQKQMQGEPTAAQQAEGTKPTGKMADKGC